MKPVAMFTCLIVLIFTLQNAHCACPYAHPYPYDLCGPNEEFQECGTACPKTCADLNDLPKACTLVYKDASASQDSSESLYMANAFRNVSVPATKVLKEEKDQPLIQPYGNIKSCSFFKSLLMVLVLLINVVIADG
ncbi:AGAP006582-PB, partial [Anopheles gambiae str. PEST]